MHQNTLRLTALHKFLDDSRAYLRLDGTSPTPPEGERRSPLRLIAARVASLADRGQNERKETAPA